MTGGRLARAARVAVLALLSASLALPWPAAADPCDRDVRPPPDTPYAYKLRGQHCEGVYMRDVAGNTLSVVSLTEWFEEYAPGADGELRIEWTAPRNAAIHLRAVATAPRVYYRMDATRAGDAKFIWKPNLLKELYLDRNRIGVLGWFRQKVGRPERSVHVPLRISQQQAAQRSSRYRVVVMASVELTEMYVSLTALNADGSVRTRVVEDRELDQDHYPADVPIAFLLEALPAEGIYLMEIGGPTRGGSSAAAELWLYSPGASSSPAQVRHGQ
jgi:hypothetical protein